MPSPTDQKFDSHFKFVYPEQDGTPELSEGFPGVIHLFEHVYDEGNPPRKPPYAFWYGVAQITCVGSDLRPTFHREYPEVRIKLRDGRQGCGLILVSNEHSEHAKGGQLIELSLVGYSTLE